LAPELRCISCLSVSVLRRISSLTALVVALAFEASMRAEVARFQGPSNPLPSMGRGVQKDSSLANLQALLYGVVH
jgi:hypothetical protein